MYESYQSLAADIESMINDVKQMPECNSKAPIIYSLELALEGCMYA